jgi:FkbM family methyltransferase
VLIEPSAACVRTLHETCALNPSVQCDVVNAAASDRSGIASFFDEGDFSTTSRIVDAYTVNRLAVRSVTTETLDQLLQERKEDFIVKVDVEGHEEKVFLGAEQLFRAGRIKLLMFERLGRTNIDNILTFFAAVNYVVFFVLEDGGITFDADALRSPLINLFACPRSVLPFVLKRIKSDVLGSP